MKLTRPIDPVLLISEPCAALPFISELCKISLETDIESPFTTTTAADAPYELCKVVALWYDPIIPYQLPETTLTPPVGNHPKSVVFIAEKREV
jgi:hypothetical protein